MSTHPSTFATTGRSPMSRHAAPHQAEANLDFVDSPRAEYLVAERTPPAQVQLIGDPLELLRRAIRGFAPVASLTAYILVEDDGVAPATRRYCARLVSDQVLAPVEVKRATAELVLCDLKKQWAKARRAKEVAGVLAECRRLAGGELSEEFAHQLDLELAACHRDFFAIQAAKWRAAAKLLAA